MRQHFELIPCHIKLSAVTYSTYLLLLLAINSYQLMLFNYIITTDNYAASYFLEHNDYYTSAIS